MCVALAQQGIQIVGVGRDEGRLCAVIDGLEPRCGPHSGLVVDLAGPSASERILRSVCAQGEAPVIVINAAGQSRPVGLGASDDAWRVAFEVEFHTPRRLVEGLMDGMVDAQFGRVVNIGGTLEPGDVANASSAAKAALAVWAKALSNGVARHGVTCNTVVPGRIATPQIDAVVHPDPVERAEFVRAHIPSQRMGRPEELAAVVSFLCSAAATYVTGAVIQVDGGMHMHAF